MPTHFLCPRYDWTKYHVIVFSTKPQGYTAHKLAIDHWMQQTLTSDSLQFELGLQKHNLQTISKEKIIK